MELITKPEYMNLSPRERVEGNTNSREFVRLYMSEQYDLRFNEWREGLRLAHMDGDEFLDAEAQDFGSAFCEDSESRDRPDDLAFQFAAMYDEAMQAIIDMIEPDEADRLRTLMRTAVRLVGYRRVLARNGL